MDWQQVRINWDLDGVLFPLSEATLLVYNRMYADDLKVEDATTYWLDEMDIKCSTEELHALMAAIRYDEHEGVEPYTSNLRIARTIADLGVPSAVISALMWKFHKSSHGMEKRQFVDRMLGRDFATILTSDKHWCCRTPDDILIDDKVKNIVNWPGRGVLLSVPWNRDDRVPGLDVVEPEHLFDHLKEMLGL